MDLYAYLSIDTTRYKMYTYTCIKFHPYSKVHMNKIRYHENQFADDEIHFVNTPFSVCIFAFSILKGNKKPHSFDHSILFFRKMYT